MVTKKIELYWHVISIIGKLDWRSRCCVHASQSQWRCELKHALASLNASAIDTHNDEVFRIDLEDIIFGGAGSVGASSWIESFG